MHSYALSHLADGVLLRELTALVVRDRATTAALLAHLAGHVDTVDIFPDFIESAKSKLSRHGIRNVTFHEGDAARGWESNQTYDAIFLTGSVAELPTAFKGLLASGGRLA